MFSTPGFVLLSVSDELRRSSRPHHKLHFITLSPCTPENTFLCSLSRRVPLSANTSHSNRASVSVASLASYSCDQPRVSFSPVRGELYTETKEIWHQVNHLNGGTDDHKRQEWHLHSLCAKQSPREDWRGGRKGALGNQSRVHIDCDGCDHWTRECVEVPLPVLQKRRRWVKET